MKSPRDKRIEKIMRIISKENKSIKERATLVHDFFDEVY
jgi:hypothetical protein